MKRIEPWVDLLLGFLSRSFRVLSILAVLLPNVVITDIWLDNETWNVDGPI